MRIALFLEEDWETAPLVARLFRSAGHTPAVNPPWHELTGFDAGMVRANFWEAGVEDRLGKALVVAARGAALFNSERTLLYTADKAVATELLRDAGLNVPATWAPRRGEQIPEAGHDELIVKPRRSSHQRGVEVFATRDEAQRHVESCTEDQLVQERIQGPCWRIIATARRAVRTYTLPVDSRGVSMLRDGAARTPVDDPDPVLEEIAVESVLALGATMLGIDVMQDADGRPWVLEGNPGFGYNPGDAEVERAMLAEAEALLA